MKEEDKIKRKIKDWIEENRSQLPLNIDSWEIQVYKKDPDTVQQPKPIELGRYNAEIVISDPFYKPYSKTFIL
ncbi:hypothetical protein [Chryseobacterium sp.]|uniref:hypothetical protein n=1 Tax=Chryseobacterium sp. TaxID=1871047 RepID=UPI000EE740D8|nr:hypothetical protein [Chryseobacterium sp.]HCA09959.1 hypothetical protein [Chryseobacterium sp.]